LGDFSKDFKSILGLVISKLNAGKHFIRGGDSLFIRQSKVIRLYIPEGKW
jgi:hypothetical protein